MFSVQLGSWQPKLMSSSLLRPHKHCIVAGNALDKGWNYCHRRSVIRATKTGSNEDPESPSDFPLDWDPFEDLFGLGVDLRFRKGPLVEKKPTPKYEVKDHVLKELPCPACGGPGYMLCTKCNPTNLEASCSQCSGKGYFNCGLCSGQRVILEESFSESAWASLHARSLSFTMPCCWASPEEFILVLAMGRLYCLIMQHAVLSTMSCHVLSSPLQIAEDEAIESMAIVNAPKRKTKRVYGPLGPETREKISRALKDLEARTGSISRRLRDIHRDPILGVQRVAAIKKARGTAESRERTAKRNREYFKSPENRLKRSQSMIGVRYKCTACGEEGHRRHFCPNLGFISKRFRGAVTRPYRCSNCGKLGHQNRKCPLRLSTQEATSLLVESTAKAQAEASRRGRFNLGPGKSRTSKPVLKLCSLCGKSGHNKRTCFAAPAASESNDPSPNK